ncbi:MAG: cobalamin-dependent protein [Anderseniella sp.]|jgi:methanogenic corrinoid protein MtbC1|nr:cobalamin-dependent protein [Anderseniella sp.]
MATDEAEVRKVIHEKTGPTGLEGDSSWDGQSSPYASVHLGETRQLLSQVVKAEIVPQLIVAKKNHPRQPEAVESNKVCKPSPEQRAEFRSLLLDGDTFDCIGFVEQLRCKGVALPEIYLDLFTPVANDLGNQWKADELSFIEVTKAVGKLQSLVHEIGCGDQTCSPLDAGHRIVFASAPGEQHVLGILIISRMFEMEGWHVAGGASLQAGDELNSVVRSEWFGVVGLSASTEHRALNLKQAIADLRESSLNKSISVVVGGTAFAHHPEICPEIGADALATDVRDAIVKAEALLGNVALPSNP